MKIKKTSSILMAMCVLAGSASGAVEASKGIDYYLIKDKEKLIHMSIEDYSNNFSNTSSNYYQHFLKDRYLEIEYLVQEQGKGPGVYSDDKYVYINDFLKNKTSNSESDSDVMGKTSGRSFEDLKNTLYKLTFKDNQPVYEKLEDAVVPVEGAELVEGINKLNYGNESLNVVMRNGYITYVGSGNIYENDQVLIEKIDESIKNADLSNEKGEKYGKKSRDKILAFVDIQNVEKESYSKALTFNNGKVPNYDIIKMTMNDNTNIFTNIYHNEILRVRPEINDMELKIIELAIRGGNASVIDGYSSSEILRFKDDDTDLNYYRIKYNIRNGSTGSIDSAMIVPIFLGDLEFKEGVNEYSVKENIDGNKKYVDEFKIVCKNNVIESVLDKNGVKLIEVPDYLKPIEGNIENRVTNHIEDTVGSNIYLDNDIRSEIKNVIDSQKKISDILSDAKKIVDNAPAFTVENLSETSKNEIYENLRLLLKDPKFSKIELELGNLSEGSNIVKLKLDGQSKDANINLLIMSEDRVSLKEGKGNKVMLDGHEYFISVYQGKVISIKEDAFGSGPLYFNENIDPNTKFLNENGKSYSSDSNAKILEYLNWENSGYMKSPINMTKLTIINRGSEYREIDFTQEQDKYNSRNVNREILEIGFNVGEGDVLSSLTFNPYAGNSKYHFQKAEVMENILGTDLYRVVVSYTITHELAEENNTNIYKFDFYIKDAGDVEYPDETQNELRKLKDKIHSIGKFEVEDLSDKSKAKVLEELKGRLLPEEIEGVDFEIVKFVDQYSDGESTVRISKNGKQEMPEIWVEVIKNVEDIDKTLSEVKKIIESNSPYTVDNFSQTSKNALLTKMNKLVADSPYRDVSLEMDGLRDGLNVVRIMKAGKEVEADIQVRPNFDPEEVRKEKNMIKAIQELEFVFNSSNTGDRDNTLKKLEGPSRIMFNKTFNDQAWKITPWANDLRIKKSSRPTDVGRDLLDHVGNVDLYFFDHRKLNENQMFPEYADDRLRVNNHNFTDRFGNTILEIPIIFRVKGQDYYLGFITRESRQALKITPKNGIYAMETLEDISYDDLIESVELGDAELVDIMDMIDDEVKDVENTENIIEEVVEDENTDEFLEEVIEEVEDLDESQEIIEEDYEEDMRMMNIQPMTYTTTKPLPGEGYTIVFKLTLRYGNEVYLGVSANHDLPAGFEQGLEKLKHGKW